YRHAHRGLQAGHRGGGGAGHAGGAAGATGRDAGRGRATGSGAAWIGGEAAGEDDRYAGACDDEVAGAIAAWDRVEAYAAARKHAAAAEFIRRRPDPGCAVQGTARMPEVWDESAAAEVAGVLAESRSAADAVLGLAYDLEVKLPGTKAAF